MVAVDQIQAGHSSLEIQADLTQVETNSWVEISADQNGVEISADHNEVEILPDHNSGGWDDKWSLANWGQLILLQHQFMTEDQIFVTLAHTWYLFFYPHGKFF